MTDTQSTPMTDAAHLETTRASFDAVAADYERLLRNESDDSPKPSSGTPRCTLRRTNFRCASVSSTASSRRAAISSRR
ncbi:hypothetical protein ABZ876_20240 [Streptomyces sp. NPDC046931]|uniref:hypothetical protein n=1 Tax=Streptomyces sp. NPDC046931 TaxID=3154806 RepID=UPI00340864AB